MVGERFGRTNGGRDTRAPDRGGGVRLRARAPAHAPPLHCAPPGPGGHPALSRASSSPSGPPSTTASTTTSIVTSPSPRRTWAASRSGCATLPKADYPIVREETVPGGRDPLLPRARRAVQGRDPGGAARRRDARVLLPARRVRRPLPRAPRAVHGSDSGASSSSRPPAPTGGATSGGRCSSASTGRPGSRRRSSTGTSGGSRRRSAATTGSSAASWSCSPSTTSRPGRRSGCQRAWWSSASSSATRARCRTRAAISRSPRRSW